MSKRVSAKQRAPITVERSNEIMRTLSANVPKGTLSAAERKTLQDAADEREERELYEKGCQQVRDRDSYLVNPATVDQRLQALLQCLVPYEVPLIKRVEDELEAKEIQSSMPGVTDEEWKQLIRSGRLGAYAAIAPNRGLVCGAHFDDVVRDITESLPGIPDEDIRATLEYAKRKGLVVENEYGLYEITDAGRERVLSGQSSIAKTVDEAVRMNDGDEWATVRQLAKLAGKTQGAIRSAIGYARRKGKTVGGERVSFMEAGNVQDILEARSGSPRKRYRIRYVWKFIS